MSKIIKEMARDIRPVLENRVDIGFIPDLDKPIAQTLVKQGYRRISEDSILLSKTDFDLILPPNRVVLSIEEYENINRPTSCISKETAKEIFAKIDNELCECTIVHNGGDYGWKLQGYERNDLTKRLTKIAEQYGTSIEEYKKAAYRDHLLLENYYGHAKEQTEKVQADNESLYGDLTKFEEIVRKEMAEEILKKIDKELYDISRLYLEHVAENIKDDDAINNYGVMTIAHNVVVNVAKEYGAEIRGEE